MFTHVMLVNGLAEPHLFNTLCALTDCASVVFVCCFLDLKNLMKNEYGHTQKADRHLCCALLNLLVIIQLECLSKCLN